MEFATGAMSALLPKLGELLREEFLLKKSVKQGIKDLKAELECMQTALVKVSDVPLDQLDPLVKLWANEVRELSYVIEDSLDSFMVHFQGREPAKPHTIFVAFINNMRNKITDFKIRHKIANDIQDIGSRVRKVKERYDRYKLHDVAANVARTRVDPRLSAMYNKVSDLVGIDKPIDDIMKSLSENSHMPERSKLKTFSIVGFGGLGKTTLVKAVYDKLNKKFDCGVFVLVGQNPDMKKVLGDIIHELGVQMCTISSMMDVRQLINHLRKLLTNKRYLIVIDDIWDVQSWEIIKYAFPDNNHGSRVMTTTRICEVAKKVGGIYNMKPLSDDNSKKLFSSRIFGEEGTNLDNQSVQVCNKILRKCGGVPLSIITIASLLAGKEKEDWSKVYDSIGFGLEEQEVVQNTRKILSFSYYDLPYYLKTCLLYLSVFPEDNWINKNTLIWRWVAEGFVSNKHGIGSFEEGESYLNDLINRSMIMWIEPSHRVNVGRCRVHDMVLDLIRSLSSKENFVTIHDLEHHKKCLTSNNARRLALHKIIISNTPSIEVEHIRSFNASMCRGSRMPSLLRFKVLRVLVLEECDFLDGGCHLEHVGKLVHLRYLGLFGTPIDEIPREIGELMYLQSLDVRESGIEELSPSIGELTKLMCLRASKGTRMMADVRKLTALQELRLFSVDKIPNFFKDLGKLTELRVLEIHFDKMDERSHRALVKSLCSLRRIKTLEIYCDSVDIQGGDWEDWMPAPYELRELTLSGMVLPRRLPWMASSCVPHLSYLFFTAQVVEQQDLQILGSMPSLRCLNISSVDNCAPYTILESDEFQNLRYLRTNIEIKCGVGALPMLHKLVCGTSIGIEDVGLASRSMPLLEKVTYLLNCKNYHGDEVKETEAKLRHAARIHPNSPALEIRRHKYKNNQQELPRLIIQSLKRVLRDGGEVSTTDEELDDGGARKIARITREEGQRDMRKS
uniref:Uncharacterized protein n=1 Tax=Hordeum vulgare subsp. vulgare TaxID=112509 RepID=A0A8I6XWF6_HORVV